MIRLFFMLSLQFAAPKLISAWVFEPFTKIQKDYQALTRRVTARHILLPSEEACVVLKQKIRNKSSQESSFVVDVFEQAASKYSRDDETSSRGGLLGELMPQGYCRSPQLDRACFQVRLGIVEGPMESEYGKHLLLVTERTNCPKLDGENTKLVWNSESKQAELVPSTQVGQVTGEFALGQVAFWIFAFLAGGVVAELAAQVGDTVVVSL